MPFARGPVLGYTGRGRYTTIGPTEYVGSDDVIVIPSDFVTDLASVPRVFWGLIPPQGAYESAAVLHDWLCTELARVHRNVPARRAAGWVELEATGWTPPPGSVNARDTDGLFRRVMREAGVGFCTRWIMWTGVRWGALANPARRAGWWRDAPVVLGISATVLAAVLAGVLAAHTAVDWLLALA